MCVCVCVCVCVCAYVFVCANEHVRPLFVRTINRGQSINFLTRELTLINVGATFTSFLYLQASCVCSYDGAVLAALRARRHRAGFQRDVCKARACEGEGVQGGCAGKQACASLRRELVQLGRLIDN